MKRTEEGKIEEPLSGPTQIRTGVVEVGSQARITGSRHRTNSTSGGTRDGGRNQQNAKWSERLVTRTGPSTVMWGACMAVMMVSTLSAAVEGFRTSCPQFEGQCRPVGEKPAPGANSDGECSTFQMLTNTCINKHRRGEAKCSISESWGCTFVDGLLTDELLPGQLATCYDLPVCVGSEPKRGASSTPQASATSRPSATPRPSGTSAAEPERDVPELSVDTSRGCIGVGTSASRKIIEGLVTKGCMITQRYGEPRSGRVLCIQVQLDVLCATGPHIVEKDGREMTMKELCEGARCWGDTQDLFNYRCHSPDTVFAVGDVKVTQYVSGTVTNGLRRWGVSSRWIRDVLEI
jgi:hypothetical protein